MDEMQSRNLKSEYGISYSKLTIQPARCLECRYNKEIGIIRFTRNKAQRCGAKNKRWRYYKYMEKRRKEDEVRGRDERDDGEMRCMGDVITAAT